MSNAPRDQAGPEIITQEHILLDAAERISKIRDGRMAVHLHLSRLKPQNRQEGFLRVAGRMLEPMISAYRGQIFLLSNSDIVFLVNQPNPGDVRDHIHKLRGLFAKDPLTHDDAGDGVDLFSSIYDLAFDYDAFLSMVQGALSDARLQARRPPAAPDLKSLDAESLNDVLDRLIALDVSQFIRRQSAVNLGGQGRAEVIFQEYFVSLADLQKAIAPGINLLSNRWMFHHLTQTLDQRVLSALQRMRLTHAPPAMHLNLALTSLSDPSFQAFVHAKPADVGLGVEIRILDILADSRAFADARADLRDKGHHLVIDGLDEATLRFMEVGKADADLYKVDWSPELRQADRSSVLLGALKHLDPEKLLLARCDSEAAISWGMEHGMMKFQGRYVETMLAATTLALCDKAVACACSLAQCTQRHSVISGPLRGECGNNRMLDTPPPMRAPARKT